MTSETHDRIQNILQYMLDNQKVPDDVVMYLKEHFPHLRVNIIDYRVVLDYLDKTTGHALRSVVFDITELMMYRMDLREIISKAYEQMEKEVYEERNITEAVRIDRIATAKAQINALTEQIKKEELAIEAAISRKLIAAGDEGAAYGVHDEFSGDPVDVVSDDYLITLNVGKERPNLSYRKVFNVTSNPSPGKEPVDEQDSKA